MSAKVTSAERAVMARYMTPREAAERLLISERAVRNAISRGELPAVKVCRRVRITHEDFEGWVASARIEPPARRVVSLPTGGCGAGLRAVLRDLD